MESDALPRLFEREAGIMRRRLPVTGGESCVAVPAAKPTNWHGIKLQPAHRTLIHLCGRKQNKRNNVAHQPATTQEQNISSGREQLEEDETFSSQHTFHSIPSGIFVLNQRQADSNEGSCTVRRRERKKPKPWFIQRRNISSSSHQSLF
jgi:hypothetical protein